MPIEFFIKKHKCKETAQNSGKSLFRAHTRVRARAVETRFKNLGFLGFLKTLKPKKLCF